jgi:hypothetical protein
MRLWISLPVARRRWQPHLAIIFSALIVGVACGGGDSDGEATAAPSETIEAVAVDPLDCETAGYPCSWADIDPTVRDRSLELAHGAADQLASAGSFAEAAAWLETQDGIAELIADEGGIRFRLDGGRPVWVFERPEATVASTPRGSELLVSSSPLAAVAPPEAAAASVGGGTSTAGGEADGRVVGMDPELKTALVVAPFAWYSGMEADQITRVLEDTRGYAGAVRYEANTAETAADVSIDTFTQLAGYDFLYVRSLGGGVCPPDEPCHSTIAVQELHNKDYHLLDEQISSLDIIVWGDGTESLAVEADFFRQTYRGGIPNTLIFFDVYLPKDEGLIRSIKHPSSEFSYWNGFRRNLPPLEPVVEYLANLASTGRSTSFVYHELVGLLQGPLPFEAVKPAIQEAAFRVREVVQLMDSAGAELRNGSAILVDGKLDDGEPDTIHVTIRVDGIPESEAEHTTINLGVDGEQREPKLPAEGTRLGDSSWTVTWDVRMEDIKKGQEIELLAIAQLVEGGLSQQQAVVVAGVPDIGTVWEGSSLSVSTTQWPGVTITRNAEVTFTRDEDEGPDETVVTFSVTGGTMTWEIKGSDGNCTFAGGPVEIDLPQGSSSRITFDLRGAAIRYYGTGSVPEGPEILVLKRCGGDNEDYLTRAEGVWWLAPQDEGDFLLNGSLADGTWNSGARISTTFDWSFHKVE